MIFAVVKDKTIVEIRPPKLDCHGMVLNWVHHCSTPTLVFVLGRLPTVAGAAVALPSDEITAEATALD